MELVTNNLEISKLHDSLQIDHVLLKLMYSEFTEDQQRKFVDDHLIYLKYNPKTDFVVEFDEKFAKRMGYSTKGNAKRVLEKHFVVDIDYKSVIIMSDNNLHGGPPTEQIFLNIKCYKKFGQVAQTEEGAMVREYYCIMEETMHEYTETLRAENEIKLRLQYEESQRLLEESQQQQQDTQKQLELLKNKIYEEAPKDGLIYAYSVDLEKKIGKSVNDKERKKTYNTSHNEVELITRYMTSEMKLLEKVVFHCLKKYRNGISELFTTNNDHINNVILIAGVTIDTLASSLDNITFDEIITKINENLIIAKKQNVECKKDDKSKTTQFQPIIIQNNIVNNIIKNPNNIQPIDDTITFRFFTKEIWDEIFNANLFEQSKSNLIPKITIVQIVHDYIRLSEK